MSKHEENAIKARTYNFWGDNQAYTKTVECPVITMFNSQPVSYIGIDFTPPTDIVDAGITFSENHLSDAFRYWIDNLSTKQVDKMVELYTPKTCTCGTRAVYGDVPISSHAHYCDLRRK